MRFVGRAFRGHDPRWSWSPLSGEGACLKGGRFNRVGREALYLASSIDGVFAEQSHGFAGRLQPLTVCEYDLDVEPIADLRSSSACEGLDVDHEQLACPWRYMMAQGKEPPSWLIADRLQGANYCGVLVPSFARTAKPDAFNIVLWRWGAGLPRRVTVHDPSGRLPKSDLSWR